MLSTLALLGGLTLGAAACGGGDGGQQASGDLPSLVGGDGGTTDDDGTSSGPVSEEEQRQAMIDHARCMREHGIDVSDPVFDEDGRGAITVQAAGAGAPGEGPDEAAMEAAMEACDPIMDRVRSSFEAPSPEEQAEHRQQMLAYAQCMRDAGFDVPDPEFDGDRVKMRAGSGQGQPGFEDAAATCSDQVGMAGMFAAGPARVAGR